ncbi:unnamed protein product [Rotaria magnacalcarata]|uniref:HAT C-terminal dimerisation domain-containing protein n=1 Tax=Rotaria magnacalcarata TaxID=392030 RepID=A0A816ZE12_9BILA|nr:unnamed protein product [Rotaria magnacalcarata]CAF2208998.1 unnamed protein product [Rotaria magnacalcarata]CAF4174241.1 unnamed protein product [Rotaria magnacalcarata]CAF4250747.1 unnamed protein product [Rotaria magnacalcarata]
MCPHPREHAIDLLKQEMLSRQEDAPVPCTSAVQNSSEMSSSISSTSHPSSSSSNSISKQITSTARKDLLMEIFDKKGSLTEKRVVEQELEKYLTSMTVLENEDDNDILSYWREHQQAFPLIASTARHILAIAASNTSHFATNNTENSNASNDESIKKFKPNDVVINHQNHNEDLACLTNDDEELSF